MVNQIKGLYVSLARVLLMSVWVSVLASPASLFAQHAIKLNLPVGNSPGTIGLAKAPNEECHGPTAIAAASAGRLAILDGINKKVVLVGKGSSQEIPLPVDLIEPVDIVVTTRGFIVLGAIGDVAFINNDGFPIIRIKSNYNPEKGSLRLAALATGGVAIEDIEGNRIPIDINPLQAGELVAIGIGNASSYSRIEANPNQVILTTNSVAGPLAKISITSRMRVVNARVLWVSEGNGALVAVQETRQLPEESAFVRLVTINAAGDAKSEAYLPPEAYACDIRRPFARTTDGKIVSLVFSESGGMTLNEVSFKPIGQSTPKPVAHSSDAALISEEQDVLTTMERLNDVTSASSISLNPTSRTSIVERARAALNINWVLNPANFSSPGVPNLCNPTNDIWRRPHRLDNKQGNQVKAIPYRWGGYFGSLDTFKRHIKDGKLAGSVCTCRKGNCIYKGATGLDCSGFVSYAWKTGRYFTTGSLPNPDVSSPIAWSALQPGDIVNKQRSHVRLVESISNGSNGRIVTVIESATNESCGGVCRKSYLQADLQQRGYKPFRRNALTI